MNNQKSGLIVLKSIAAKTIQYGQTQVPPQQSPPQQSPPQQSPPQQSPPQHTQEESYKSGKLIELKSCCSKKHIGLF